MKRVLFSIIAFVLIFSMMFSGTALPASAEPSGKGESEVVKIEGIADYQASIPETQAIALGFVPVLCSEGLTLLYKQETAEVALYSSKTGELIYSNPQDIAPETKGTPLHRMTSQLYITFYENNSQIKFYSSRFDSLERDQVTSTLKDDTLSVNYVFGKKKIVKEMLPAAIPEKKFEKLLSKLSDDEAFELKKQYKAISEKDKVTEATKQKYRDKYKNFGDEPIYILNIYIPDYELEPVYNLLTDGGYSDKDREEDNKASGNEVELVDTNVVFDLTLNYSISQGALKAELDCSRLRVLDNADIASISVLEFFGAGNRNDSGYVLVPDGSGGLVEFNSSKNSAAAFSGTIYGNDRAIKSNGLDNNDVKIHLPVLGVSRNNGGFFAIADTGAQYCSINADIADDTIPYNVGYFSANINPYDAMTVANPIHGGGTTQIFVRQKEPYKGNVCIYYYPLEQGKNTYSDMANFYRERLKAQGVLKEKLSGDIPFVYSLVGAIDVKKHFLGIPYTGMKSLTTFDEAEKIIKAFEKEGIGNQHVKYLAWFNGGMKQTLADKVKVLGCLGGKKGLSSLMSSDIAEIYPNVRFTTTTNTFFDSFSVKKDAARLTYNESALLYPISIPKNFFDYNSEYSYVVSVNIYDEIIGKFLKKYKYDNLSLEDLGGVLNSDFNEDKYAERGAALEKTNAAIDKLADKYNLMASAPNLYAVDDVTIMTDIPTGASGSNIISVEVPFFQMVFSGYKDMTASAANISYGNFGASHLVAFGTLPNYTFGYEKSSEIMNTGYTELYSICYKDWAKDAVETFKAVTQNGAKLRGVSIVSHKILSSGLVELTYENGAMYIINDTSSEITDGDITLGAGEFIFKEGN